MLAECLRDLLLDLVDDSVDHARVAAGGKHKVVADIGELGEIDDANVLGTLERGRVGGGTSHLDGGNAGRGRGSGAALDGGVALGGMSAQAGGVVEKLIVGHVSHGKPFL
ncbi:Uncharacterised protein [Collinsella intestinalis]|nr:Uncharacterised protein [Collinsella intestinalis]